MRSASMSASGMEGPSTPALLTKPSRGPNALCAASNIAITSASTDTSPRTASARPPAASTSATASAAAAAFPAKLTPTDQPRRAASRAAARPMPRLAPVIRTAFDITCLLAFGAALFRQGRAGASHADSNPVFQDHVRRHGLDLLAVAVVVDGERGVVGFVGRTAQGIGRDHDAVAAVDGAQNGAEHADVRLAARDHERVDAAPLQTLVQVRLDPRRINVLVDDLGRGHE